MVPPGFSRATGPDLGVAVIVLPGFSALEVTRWHPGRGGVASRASPQQDAPISSCKFGRLQSCQDSGAEAGGSHVPGSVVGGRWQDWLAKSCEEVASFGEEEVLTWAKAVLAAGGLKGPAENTMKGIGRVLKILSENEVTGKALLRLTVEKMMAAPYNIPGGPAEILAERIQLLKEPEARLENRLLLTLF